MATVIKDDIKNTLKALNILPGDTVIVHSSMKSMGYVEGGPDTVIDAFLEQLGDEGTLVMPALCQKNWETVYEDWHPDRPSEVGLITEVFRKREGVLRSDHPSHSVSAMGKKAKEITENHSSYGPRVGPYGEYGFGKSSPWQKMYDMNAKIVMLGVSIGNNTMKHLAEYMIFNSALDSISDPFKRQEMEKEIQHYGQPAHDKWVWSYITSSKMLPIYEEKGIIKRAVCGDAEFIATYASDCVDATIDIAKSDPLKWLGESATNWLNKCEKLRSDL